MSAYCKLSNILLLMCALTGPTIIIVGVIRNVTA